MTLRQIRLSCLLLAVMAIPSLGFAPFQTSLTRPAAVKVPHQPRHSARSLVVLGFAPILRPAAENKSLQPSTAVNHKHNARSLVLLRYGEKAGVDAQLLFDTWEWTANLGAPAALVAGAVLATMVESREDMSPKKSDTRVVRIAKKLCRFLLLSSFGLEVISIFVTTVTGTVLLSEADAPAKLGNLAFNSPLGYLKNNLEFEYLTARIAFLQGLFHWLASVSLELLIPKKGEGVAARRMNRFTSSALATILVGMLSFLNRHVTFYMNYAHMLHRYAIVCFQKFIWPPRPLTVLLLPMTLVTTVLGYRAFMTPIEAEEDDD